MFHQVCPESIPGRRSSVTKRIRVRDEQREPGWLFALQSDKSNYSDGEYRISYDAYEMLAYFVCSKDYYGVRAVALLL
ncbi:MAG: hypothetical protein MJY91_02435 [Bacteroidales bacterium]|nr:hypothetical protein [Bacteroidales bacterium]